MKLQGRGIEGFLRRPDPKVRAVLVYGPDSGLVRERVEALGRTVVDDLADPFRVADLPAARLAEDPARLADEAAAQALTGGRRFIRIRDGDDRLAKAFDGFLKAPPPGDALVVVEAGDLGKASKLRLQFEAAALAAAVPCYLEDEGALERVLQGRLADAGFRVDRDALVYLAGCLVGDRGLATREVEKLTLYMGAERTIRLDDVRACVGDAAAIGLEEPAWAAAAGDLAGVDKALARLFGEGESPVGILRTAQRYFQRLHLARARVDGGATAEAAIAALKPPVFFKIKAACVAQVGRWSADRLAQALDRLAEAEAACKRTGWPDEAVCARAFLAIATLAVRSR